MKRPALVIFLYMVAALTAAKIFKGEGIFVFVFLSVAISGILVFKKRKIFYAFLPAAAFLVLFIMLFSTVDRSENIYGNEFMIKGTVCKTSFTLNNTESVTVKNISVYENGTENKIKGRAVIYTDENNFVKLGDTIGAWCVRRSEDYNFTGFDYGNYMLLNRIAFAADSTEVYFIKNNGSGIYGKIYDLRDKVNYVIDNIYTKDDAGIIKAVSTGDTSGLSKDARNLFNSAGIAHILAISGLHIAIVAGVIIAFLEMLGINKRKSSLIAVIILGFYTVFTGGNTAVLRSFIMTAVVLMGRVFYRRSDALNSCSIAGIIILLLNPYSLFSIGFQLSFVSVAALIKLADFAEQADSISEKIKGGIIASLFVSVVTFPIISYNFYIVPLYGFITNIFVVPVLTVLVPMIFLSIFAGAFNIFLGRFFAGTVVVILKYIRCICKIVLKLPFSNITVGRLSVWFTVLFFLAIIVLFLVNDRKKACMCSILVSIVCAVVSLSNKFILKNNNLVFLNSDYGNCAVIETYDRNIYILGGKSEKWLNYKINNVIEYLNYRGFNNANAVFTFGQNEESLNFAYKAETNNAAKNIYVLSPVNADDKKYSDILSKADKTDTEVNFIKPYEKAYTGNVEIKYIYPPDDISTEINSTGILLEIDLNGKRILYADSLTETDLRYIMFSKADIKCDAIYLSDYDETEFFNDFIRKTGADIVISNDTDCHDGIIDVEKEEYVNLRLNAKSISLN